MSNKVVICHSCDLAVSLPEYKEGVQCNCPRCGAMLRHAKLVDFKTLGIISLAALIILFNAVFQPFMSISAMGLSSSMSLMSIFTTLEMNWELLLAVFLILTFLFPIIVLCLIFAVGVFNYSPSREVALIYSYCHKFSMVDVFVLGIAVSLIKLTALAEVSFYTGFYLAIVFSLMLIWILSKFLPKRMWNLYYENDLENIKPGVIGIKQNIKTCLHCGMTYRSSKEEDICPRCHAKVNTRKKMWVQKIIALVSSAAILFLPANLYPIMVTEYLGQSSESNIVQGVISLWGMGSYFVAMVILIASIFIPAFKILVISYLLLTVKFGNRTNPRVLSKMYRFVEFIGKWSMIDVFVVILMSSVVSITGLLAIYPGFAIICFCMVVLITIFAADEFDERLIWDKV